MRRTTTVEWLREYIFGFNRRTPTEQEILNYNIQVQVSKAFCKIHDLEINRDHQHLRIRELDNQVAFLKSQVEQLQNQLNSTLTQFQKELAIIKFNIREVSRESCCHGLDLQLDYELIHNIISDVIEVKSFINGDYS